ncbi:MAG: methyltransferase domain-containing protein [Candidatus Hydrothermales bacterium]
MSSRFDKIAKIYDIVNLISSFGLDHYSRWFLSKRVSGIICDLGAGKGELSMYLSKRKKVKKIFAVEISKKMLKKRFLDKKIVYVRADANFIPFKDKSFDYVVSSFVWRNIEQRELFIKESRRILKKEGKIYILEMARPSVPFSFILIPYIYIFTTILSIFFPEYLFLRSSILNLKAKELVKNYKVKKVINVFGTVFYLFIF